MILDRYKTSNITKFNKYLYVVFQNYLESNFNNFNKQPCLN